jgi:ribosomal protein RSM22 (predicted rRNA methylase)
MLKAGKIPRACYSCRLQLLSLFEYGFTKQSTSNASRAPYTISARNRPQPRRDLSDVRLRRFSGTRLRADDPLKDDPQATEAIASNIESVVRQARQTFGETLPKNYLSAEEYILYERLYGPPLRETGGEDLEYLPDDEEDTHVGPARNVLLREMANGEFEEVEFDPELGFSVIEDAAEETMEPNTETIEVEESESSEGLELQESSQDDITDSSAEQLMQIQGKNQREIEAIRRLQKDMQEATFTPMAPEAIEEELEGDEQFVEEEEEEDYEDEQEEYVSSDEIRTHPHTMTGRSRTSPSTLSLPQEQLTEPISELLARTNWKHLTEASERSFGGKGLPSSVSTPNTKKHLGQKHVGLDAGQHKMSEVEADAYLAAVMPGTYATIMSTLVEVRKRLGGQWIRDLLFRQDGEGPRVLDAGAGGAGAVAWREMLRAEWEVLKDDGIVEGEEAPSGRTTVLTGANTLRHRVSRFLDNTTFIPRLPDYVHSTHSQKLLDGASPQDRKSYDIIIAPHNLLHLKEDFRRKYMVQNLWSLLDPNGGVLILIEKGLPIGFEAIAGARSMLLETHIASPGGITEASELTFSSDDSPSIKKEEGMIIAPCTNHKGCPMYPVPGLSFGRKDFCHFAQRYIRPPFLQKVLGASARNHEDIKYSYLAVRRGVDSRTTEKPPIQGDAATDQSFQGYEEIDLPESEAEADGDVSDIRFNALSLPRLILPPLKRRGHVTLDLCTPSGKLERWTVPKSFSKTAYRDARKSRWGDLWALGAKTRTPRSPRLGRLYGESENKGKLKGVRDGRIGKGGKKKKANKFNIIMGKHGMEGIEQDISQTKYQQPQKRTKGGRVYKPAKPITDEDLG